MGGQTTNVIESPFAAVLHTGAAKAHWIDPGAGVEPQQVDTTRTIGGEVARAERDVCSC